MDGIWDHRPSSFIGKTLIHNACKRDALTPQAGVFGQIVFKLLDLKLSIPQCIIDGLFYILTIISISFRGP